AKRGATLIVVCLASGVLAALLVTWRLRPSGTGTPVAPAAAPASTPADCPECHTGYVPQVVKVKKVQPASTLRMIERLEAQRKSAEINPSGSGAFLSDVMVEYYRNEI